MKQDVLERESRARVDLLESQKIAEDMRVLTMDTTLDQMNALCEGQQARKLSSVMAKGQYGVQYRNGYYLADGIYPEWASFVKSFTVATDPKHTYFKQRQESARKDVERAFGVLQGRWGLIQQPAVHTKSTHYVESCMLCGSIDVKPIVVIAKELRDKDTHISLQQNLMNHIWREVEEALEED
ncbi:ALP1-like protein isoform X1 [Tanacetum coccineum]